MKRVLTACAILLFTASFSYAAENDTMKDGEEQKLNVTGDIEMGVADTGAINAAIGDNATAEQDEFAVESGDIKGGVQIDGVVDGSIDAAIGKDSTSKQRIGVVGH